MQMGTHRRIKCPINHTQTHKDAVLRAQEYQHIVKDITHIYERKHKLVSEVSQQRGRMQNLTSKAINN